MKKKIGDLTINQIMKIKSRCKNYNCKECKEKDKSCYRLCSEGFYIFVNVDVLNQEIEVEEDE